MPAATNVVAGFLIEGDYLTPGYFKNNFVLICPVLVRIVKNNVPMFVLKFIDNELFV